MSKVLGKGLSALISEKTNENKDDIGHIEVALIDNNSLQPRTKYSIESMNDLKASIKEKGVLQPILIRPAGSRYEVVAGERRLRAARDLGLEKIPAIVRSLSDQDALVIAIIENIQREELNPIEEAEAFQRLINEFQYTQESVAQSVGKDRTTITNFLRILRLPEEVKERVAGGALSAGHARALLSSPTEEEQKRLAMLAVNRGLSVRALEDLVREQKPSAMKASKGIIHKDAALMKVEEGLQKILGSKVIIEPKKKGGKITIEFYSPEDLNRIVKLIIQ